MIAASNDKLSDTTTMGLDPDMHFQLTVPTQVIFCLKEKNAKKINSHR